MLYHLYELNRAALAPLRAAADLGRIYFSTPLNPLSQTPFGRSTAAALEVFERVTRRYGRREFGIVETTVDGRTVPVAETVVWSRPFCRLLHFRKRTPGPKQPRLLIVAPLSGHFATLLRGTVRALLPDHDVHITDWTDARQVPLADGRFDLDDYIDYLVDILHFLGPGTHVIAVCQPSVPALAATAIMAARNDACVPASLVLMGGPIDTRRNPTAVNRLAEERGTGWFRHNAITTVPFPYPGMLREVYPGFLQLTGFMTMNLDRHLNAHGELFQHLVKGDGDQADKHREFYDEYLSVMDLTAEFYLQTVDTVFVRHLLPRGRMTHRGLPIEPGAIRDTALMTVEGEKDDISGIGQTEAAHDLCTGIPAAMREHHLQEDVGHYGVFNGHRFRAEIAPRIADFVRRHDRRPTRP